MQTNKKAPYYKRAFLGLLHVLGLKAPILIIELVKSESPSDGILLLY